MIKELTFFEIGQASVWVLCYLLPEWLWVDHLTFLSFSLVTCKGRQLHLLVSLLTVRDDLLKASVTYIWPLWLFFDYFPPYLTFFLSVSFFFRFLVPSRPQFLSGKYIISELTETHTYVLTSLNLCAFKTSSCTWDSQRFYGILACNWEKKGSDKVKYK